MSALFLELGITVLVAFYYLAKKADLSLPTRSQSKNIFIRSFTVYIGTFLNNLSILLIGIILTASVAASQPIFDLIFSHFLLKEKISIGKYLAVFAMVIGLLLVFVVN